MGDSDRPSVPNVFYDLIVFVSPSILFLLGLALGLPELTKAVVEQFVSGIRALDVVVVLLAILFVAYEYGRAVEAVSHSFVTGPLRALEHFGPRWLRKRFVQADFAANLDPAVAALSLPKTPALERHDNKWAIYFFALLYCPHIGRDLLKRYAWEKLSRSSAVTYLLLLTISVGCGVARLFCAELTQCGTTGFGSAPYSLIVLALVIVTHYEFYLRKAWNNDLLIKVLPVLLAARDLAVLRASDDDSE